MISTKTQNIIALLFCCFLVLFIVVCSSHNSFFWDTVQLGSKHAEYYYNSHFTSLLLPTDMDSGHIPTFGIYIAVLWEIFGRTLEVSHFGMLPFALGIVFQTFKVCRKFVPEQFVGLASILVLADPSLLSQMTLVSPDVCLLFFFLLGLNAVLENKKKWIMIAVFCLFLTSMRGMMVALCLLSLDIYSHIDFKTTSRKIGHQLLNKSLFYLPAVLLFLGYNSFHYMEKGWIGFHQDSPWAKSFEHIDDFSGLLLNIGYYGWRVIDFGRFGLWIIGIPLFLIYKKQLCTSKPFRLLLFFTLFIIIVLPLNMLWAKNLMGYRYLIPIYLTFSLFTATILFSELVNQKLKYSLSIFWLLCLVGGNFIVYPNKIAKGWDSTLAHLPYYNLRHQAIRYLDQEHIDFKQVQSFFPNLARIDRIDLNGDYRSFHFYDGKRKYIFYSNIFNVTDQEYDEIHNPANYKCIKHFESQQVFIDIFEKIKP